MNIKKIGIIGYGRFGPVLYRLLKDEFPVTLFSRSGIKTNDVFTKNTSITQDLSEVYKNDVIFYATPIESFDQVISAHKKYFRDGHLLIDVLSVKMHPAKVFSKHLKGKKTQAILTHPMFGPDSSKNGFEGLPMIMDGFRSSENNYKFWKDFFAMKKLKIVEMSAKKHDKLAANSQGLTHFIGRLLNDFNLKSTKIDSMGTRKLLEVKDQTCNDTWQLFTNLQHFNPYTKSMRIKLGQKYDKLYNKLLPKRIYPKYITFGIQGGKGSFNEKAVSEYIKNNNIKKFKIKYLYTSENVLRALNRGEIDRGQFAIHNSIGGVVGESIDAMARYKFKILDQFEIKIAHALMTRKDAKMSDVTTIMTHPQVLAQCKTNLSKKYPKLKLTSGKGELVDHAKVAKYLSLKKIPKNTATMGSNILAQIYGLKIIEDNLQDMKENFTSFLVVSRD